MAETKEISFKNTLFVIIGAAIVLYLISLLLKGKNTPPAIDTSKSNYIGSPSGIEYSGCLSEYSLNYPYRYGYGGYGNLGSGMTMPSWADTYNQEIAGCVSVWENGRNVIKCMR